MKVLRARADLYCKQDFYCTSTARLATSRSHEFQGRICYAVFKVVRGTSQRPAGTE